MMKIAFAALGLLVFVMLSQADSVLADSLVYHGKNVVESPPEFAGAAFHFIINDDTATVISFGPAGREIIRMDIIPSETCIQTQATLCFDGEVMQVQNPQMHTVGDKISFSIDFANKKQIGTAQSGPMQGMSVIMNVERMNLKSNEPYTISVSREGGFGGFAPKTMTFDPSGMITITQGEDETQVPLEQNQIQEIEKLFQKGKILSMPSQNYSPNEGAADYFTYGLTLNQGVFQNQFTWTDASDQTPEILKELQQKIWITGEQNIPIPVDIIAPEHAEIVSIATDFVLSSPTFAFDGMVDTLEFSSVTELESFPVQYQVEASFASSHGGYGDRTDQMVTQALTPHTMSILVSEGTVISAVTDEEWDELNNQYVLKAPN